MTTTFETAKVGDRVWSMKDGWGVVHSIEPSHCYPVSVVYPCRKRRLFTSGGLYDKTDIIQTLFWDEVVIEAPKKPLPDLEVDAKVFVWNDPKQKHKRHFSHFRNGVIWTFDAGNTSFTRLHKNSITHWLYWELAE